MTSPEAFCPEKIEFFDDMGAMHLALTFDDVREETRWGGDAPLPRQLDISTKFSKHNDMKAPFVSSAMGAVTEDEMAVAQAEFGGIGVIHAGQSIEAQKDQVRKVKYHRSGLIDSPKTVTDNMTLEQVLNRCEEKDWPFRTFPVTDSDGKFVGLLTSNDFKFGEEFDQNAPVSRLMTPASQVVTALGLIEPAEALQKMKDSKRLTLPLIDTDGRVAGLYVWNDVRKLLRRSDLPHNVDDDGRLRVAGAVPTRPDEALARVEAMLGEDRFLDAVVIDSSDGDSYEAVETLKALKHHFPDVDVVAGNVSNGESARNLALLGADGVKVGQGPGSICSTRRELGIGMPQVTAVYECVRAIMDLEPRYHVPVCADGGIRYHGDISIAIAAGAHSVMMGGMFAGTDEAPSKKFFDNSGVPRKEYWGEGSPKGTANRYGERDGDNPLYQGVEGDVPFKGSVVKELNLCAKALRESMRLVKAPSLEYHRLNTRLRWITNAGLTESHPHDVRISTTS